MKGDRETELGEKDSLIYDEKDDYQFIVRGPLGKGLMIQQSGIHIAFAAGTGVLAFVDLVAYLALSYLDLDTAVITDENSLLDKNKFKLVLYVSYKTQAEAIALELLYSLADYCSDRQDYNTNAGFELFVRLSKEGINTDRWNKDFVLQEMKKYDPEEVKRVMVCGPPAMT
jgi:NAD(P)H-flavin reductase